MMKIENSDFFCGMVTKVSYTLFPASAIAGGSYQRQPSYHLLIQSTIETLEKGVKYVQSYKLFLLLTLNIFQTFF